MSERRRTTSRPRGTSAAGVRLAVVGVVAAVAGLATAAPAAADGAPYLDETFSGATVVPGFVAYGSACLTGAAAGAPGSGDHPLAGCPTARTGPVPPTDAAPHGFLQLTDASNDQAGAVLFDVPIPATQGLTVTFEQWQYGTTTPTGPTQAPADGIAFFLTDGEATLDAPGAFGGSLGYAQKLPDDDPARDFLPGVNDGYLGIGLDALGNFFGDWERRSNGCPADQRSPAGAGFRRPEPDKVTVRGPGDGTEGYCFLTSTAANLDSTAGPWPSTLPFSLRSDLVALPPGAEPAEAALHAVRRTVTVTVSPAPSPRVTVSLSRGGGAPEQVLDLPAPDPVPDSYKFGFSASTGAFTDVHLVRNVVLESVDPAPLLRIRKRVLDDGPFQVGDVVDFGYTVTNTGLAAVDDLRVLDDRIPAVACRSTRLAPRSDAAGRETECRGRYRVRASDVDRRGRVVNVATATAEDGAVTAPPVDASIRVVEPPTPPTPPTPAPTSAAPAPPTDPFPPAAPAAPVSTLADTGMSRWAPTAGVLGLALVVAGTGALLLARHRTRAARAARPE
ncbi:DUF7507 domain-containing protein [Aeromicrobium massiliense]|uniref:DUF7507 domain-containing protein n=1 Tax=Aeromicrobium massiliense TaxID=1464554 RepID=UPI0005787A1E|nr:hypothetical protein [Aeromicrobium massiliense]